MPFKSKKQSKACFATHGFGNKVDCKKWAHVTDYKNLKKMGGKSKMGKCKYGCMQAGGITVPAEMRMQGSQNPFNFSSINTTCPPGYYWSAPDNQCRRVVPGGPQIVQRDQPLGPANYTPPTPSGFHTGVEGSEEFNNGIRPPDSVTETTTITPTHHNYNQDVFLGLRGAQVAASFLASKKRDRRMNEYDYKQQTALGMNAMPISAFQYSDNNYTTPNRMYAEQGGIMNPFSYHAKYGGNLKHILKDYRKWTNDAEPMDMGEGNIDNAGKMKKGGFAMDEMVVRDFISKLMEFGHGPHPYRAGKKYSQMGGNPFAQPTPKLTPDVINLLHGRPTQQEQLLRQRNTVVAVPGGSSIPGDSTRYMTGRANQFGVPYTVDHLGVKGIADIPISDFLKLQREKMRVYQDSVLGNVNGFQAKGGRFMGINPAHKGYCTPMTKSTCTPRRKALAKTLKKHHGFHK